MGRLSGLRCKPGVLPGLAALAAAGLLAACGAARPRAISYGHEVCANCIMTVSDDRFGAELVTRTGKIYVFDSAECLAEYVRAHPGEAGGSLWVTDFTRPGTLVPVARAQFRRTQAISSPMGLGVAALASGAAAPAELSGPALTWAQVRALSARGGAREALH